VEVSLLPSPVSRPAVRVNQLGYLPGLTKRATWVTSRRQPAPFRVVDDRDTTLLEGTSEPWAVSPEPTSGMTVQVLDFTPVPAQPAACRLLVDGGTSHPFRIADDLYDRLGRDALDLLHLLRSGCPIDESRYPGYGRPAGHLGRLPNRGDTAVPAWTGPEAELLYPGWRQPGLFDVSGGWYDAGDYGKYTVSGGIALWQLLHLAALRPRTASDPVLQECRWQLDWMLRMQVPDGHRLAGTAFHRIHGTTWSPLPGWAHEDPTDRVLHRPSTAATLHLAATAATGARVFAPLDPGYAGRLLAAARSAHPAATAHPRLLAPDDAGRYGGGPYHDAEVGDDFYWAEAELWLATGEQRYATRVRASPWHTADVFDPEGFDFDRVAGPARLDLALHEEGHGEDSVRSSVLSAGRRLLDLQAGQPWGQPYAPAAGWAWGSNGRILNNLVVLAAAHRLTSDQEFLDAAAEGMDYLLGRNALGQSYVTGYGTDSSSHQRTRQFGHDLDPGMPPPPRGALAGGANSTETPGFPSHPELAGLPPQRCYLDDPTSETTNDICIRWNAPLAYVAAYLQLAGGVGPVHVVHH
jgi:endoglucanase